MSEQNKIKGKIVLKGQIECRTPLHIGSGREEHSDLDIMRDANGEPFIPATSLVGVLRHTILERCFNGNKDPKFKRCWGFTEEDKGQQSAISCMNLTLVNGSPVVRRDGIRINNKKGIVRDKGKYDYELLERGARFNLDMEFTYFANTESYIKQTARTIYELLLQDQLSLGAKTTAGLGAIALLEENTNFYLFNFHNNKGNVYRWLTQQFCEDNLIPASDLAQPFPFKKNKFSITATFQLQNSLIVRSYGNEAEYSDAAQLKSLDKWVVPGTSLKGAIRARAERIVNTLELQNACEILIDLFGFVEEELKEMDCQLPEKFNDLKAKKGKIRIHEVYLDKDDFPTELQTRIKIDRFTGGVMEGALFDSMPVFAPEQSEHVTINMEIDNYEEYEAGLLLLVLKDIWSGDLPVGGEKNVGRGVFQGIAAEIKWNGKTIKIADDIDQLSAEEKADLQYFVDALNPGEIQ